MNKFISPKQIIYVLTNINHQIQIIQPYITLHLSIIVPTSLHNHRESSPHQQTHTTTPVHTNKHTLFSSLYSTFLLIHSHGFVSLSFQFRLVSPNSIPFFSDLGLWKWLPALVPLKRSSKISTLVEPLFFVLSLLVPLVLSL